MSQIIENKLDYQISLPFFQGPLDLLLFLIKEKQLAIEEISISLITNDFIQYVKHYQQIRHHAISEFIAMASLLLYLKSNQLLPMPKNPEWDEEIEDPRKTLVYQLIEYEKLKRMTAFLQENQDNTILIRRSNEELNAIKEKFSFKESDFRELLDCYLSFFNPKAYKIVDRVKEALSTVEEKIKWLSSLLVKKIKISFFKATHLLEKAERIVAFQASLEMAKQNTVLLEQEEPFGDITLINPKGIADGEQEEIA